MVIVGLPAFMTAYGPFMILLMIGYQVKHLRRWIATYAFYRIIQTKPDDLGEKRWLFKDMDLTDEKKILSKVLSSLFYLFLVLYGGVVLLFYQLLLLEISFRCDPNEKLDCFKFMIWDLETIKNFSRVAIDCNSHAAKNGTVEMVMCYKFVLNFGLAAGASYGSFQITMVFLNLATAAFLMIKQAKTICLIRMLLVVLSLCMMGGIGAVHMFSSLHSLLSSDNWVFALECMVSIITGCLFVFGIPWKKLIALKAVDNQPATRLRAVPPSRPPASAERESREDQKNCEGQRDGKVQQDGEVPRIRGSGSGKERRSRQEQRRREQGLPNPAADAI